MAGPLSSYAESGILSHLFRTDTFQKPATIAVALCGNVPSNTDTGSLSTGHELANAGAYARQVVATGDANWLYTTTNNSGTVMNASAINFPTATADWGWISGVAIVDSTTYNGGHYIVGGAITTPKLIGNGDSFSIPASGLVLYL